MVLRNQSPSRQQWLVWTRNIKQIWKLLGAGKFRHDLKAGIERHYKATISEASFKRYLDKEKPPDHVRLVVAVVKFFRECEKSRSLEELLIEVTGYSLNDVRRQFGSYLEGSDQPLINLSMADQRLQKDSADELVEFYYNETAVEVSLLRRHTIPFVQVIHPIGQGFCHEQKLHFKVLKEDQYRLPVELNRFADPVKKGAPDKFHSNLEVFRVEQIEAAAKGVTVFLRSAEYFDALGSNFNMDSPDSETSETLRQYLHGNTRRLTPFKTDPLVNHLGAVMMVESADGYLIVQERSGVVANRAYTRSSSVSGVVKGLELKAYAHHAISLEELASVVLHHGSQELAIDFESIRFLGMFREFLRGGKPELYFYAKTSRSLSYVQDRLPKAEHSRETRKISGLAIRNRVQSGALENSLDYNIDVALKEVQQTGGNMTLIAGVVLTADHLKRWDR